MIPERLGGYYMSKLDFEFDSPLHPYLKAMISKLPSGPKLIMKTLANKEYNKEDLAIQSKVRRGELNFALIWIEALGLVDYNASGRQKLYGLTPLGRKAFEEFNELFEVPEDEQ